MTFSLVDPRKRSKEHASQAAERKLHLSLESLERRCLLSASSLDPGFTPISPGGSGSAAAITLAATPPGVSTTSTPAQLQQVYFTVSLLYSGVQIPIAPYEKVMAQPPPPNVVQQFPAPVMSLTAPGLTIPTPGVRFVRLGGSGGDVNLAGANPGSALYAENVEDQIWPTFGERETKDWLSEGPEQEMLERLTDLGDLDLFAGHGEGVQSNPFAPSGNGTEKDPGGSDWLDNDFDFNDGGKDDSSTPHSGDSPRDDSLHSRDSLRDNEMLEVGTPVGSDKHTDAGVRTEQAAEFDPAAQAEAAVRRLPVESDWSSKPSPVVAAVTAWMLASGKPVEESLERVGYFQRRRKG